MLKRARLAGLRAAYCLRVGATRRQLAEAWISTGEDELGIAVLREAIEPYPLGGDPDSIGKRGKYEINSSVDIDRSIDERSQTILASHIGIVRIRMIDGDHNKSGIRQRLGSVVMTEVPAAIAVRNDDQRQLFVSSNWTIEYRLHLECSDRHVFRCLGTAFLRGSPTRGLLETRLGELVEVIIRLPRRQFKVRNQTTEAKIGVRILNRMTELGCPEFKRVA